MNSNELHFDHVTKELHQNKDSKPSTGIKRKRSSRVMASETTLHFSYGIRKENNSFDFGCMVAGLILLFNYNSSHWKIEESFEVRFCCAELYYFRHRY